MAASNDSLFSKWRYNADDYFNEFLHTPLKYFLPGTEKLAGVDHTEPLTQAEYPVAGHSFLICWKYSFKLKNDTFPGSLGCLGRALFKWTFIDRDYADYMDVGLNAIKAHAEGKMNRQ